MGAGIDRRGNAVCRGVSVVDIGRAGVMDATSQCRHNSPEHQLIPTTLPPPMGASDLSWGPNSSPSTARSVSGGRLRGLNILKVAAIQISLVPDVSGTADELIVHQVRAHARSSTRAEGRRGRSATRLWIGTRWFRRHMPSGSQ